MKESKEKSWVLGRNILYVTFTLILIEWYCIGHFSSHNNHDSVSRIER